MTTTTTPIALNRRQAAELLGVSVDTIKKAQASGALRARNTRVDPETGKARGTTLYAYADLVAWFEQLEPA